MNNRKYIIRVLFSVAISLLVAFSVITYSGGPTKGESSTDILLLAFGGALLNKQNTIANILLGILPTFAITYFFATYIVDDFSSYCIYIFTRSESRLRWIMKKIAGLFLNIILFYIINFIATFFLLSANGFSSHLDINSSLCGLLLILNTLSVFMLLFPMNLLAIKRGAVQSFIICISFYLILIITGIYSMPALSTCLPFSQGNYAWHQPLWISKVPNGEACVIKNFSLSFSLCYLLIVNAIEIFIGILIIKNKDLLIGSEGEN